MDNDTNEVEEESLLDLLAAESGQSEDEYDEEIDETNELPDDPEALRALLLKEREIKSKRNKSLKKSKEANHRIQDELKALQDSFEEFRSSPNQSPDVEAQKREQAKAYEELRDSVNDDPSKAVDLITDMQNKTVDFLARQQAEFDAKLNKITKDLDPERHKYRDQIATLRNNPRLANLDDDSLIAVIEATGSVKPRGSIGGRRATVAPVDSDEAYKAAREKYAKMYGDM